MRGEGLEKEEKFFTPPTPHQCGTRVREKKIHTENHKFKSNSILGTRQFIFFLCTLVTKSGYLCFSPRRCLRQMLTGRFEKQRGRVVGFAGDSWKEKHFALFAFLGEVLFRLFVNQSGTAS